MSTSKISISTATNWLKSLFERNCDPKLLIRLIKRDSSISELGYIPEPVDLPISEPKNVTEEELSEWMESERNKLIQPLR